MFYVYILNSREHDEYYIGYTSDLKARLKDHNSGKASHTSKFKPWDVINYVAFATEKKAIAFERYLKSGSGRAFSKRHLLD